MKEDLWVLLITDVILLYLIVDTAIRYKKHRVNYYLVPLIIYVIFFVGFIAWYFAPAGWLHVGRVTQILFLVALAIILTISLFYWEIKRLINRYKTKK